MKGPRRVSERLERLEAAIPRPLTPPDERTAVLGALLVGELLALRRAVESHNNAEAEAIVAAGRERLARCGPAWKTTQEADRLRWIEHQAHGKLTTAALQARPVLTLREYDELKIRAAELAVQRFTAENDA
jgi:hypothetical protein